MEEAVARPVAVAMKAVAAKAAATLAVARAPLTPVSPDKTQAAKHGSPSSSAFVTTHSRLCSTQLAHLTLMVFKASVSAATSTSGNRPVTPHQVSHLLVSPTVVMAAIVAGATLAGHALAAAVVAANAAPVVAEAEVAHVALVAVAVAVVHTADDKQLAAVVTLQD